MEGEDLNVLPRLTPVPTRRQHKFVLAKEQTTFALRMLVASEGSNEKTRLATLVMRDLPAAATIQAVFHLKRLVVSQKTLADIYMFSCSLFR